MRFVVPAATVGLLLSAVPVFAAPRHDPFADETPQQREARKADLRDLKEKEERAQELRDQRELEHPEIIYDEHEDDVDE